MTNGIQMQAGDPRVKLWKKALATGVKAITTSVLVNYADPMGALYSRAWFLHMLIAASTTFVIMESNYWKEWADGVLGTHFNGNKEE